MDNIKVAIRVRPLIGRENGMVNHWNVQEDTIKSTEATGKLSSPYTFDRIFDEMMTTYDIFEEICKPIISDGLKGFNGTIFAYGQSSSGKTFTMSGSQMQKGIITLSVEEIFAIIEASHHREFLIRVAYMEIYNEKVTDLLSSEEKGIKIQEDQEKNIQVTGLKEELVSTSSDVLTIIQKGDNRRHMAETKQNDRSSRSHCIIRIIIESREKGDEGAVMVAHLNFVDLAGSEKAGENSGDRLREGCSINKSLLILGQVISKLSDGVSNQHISYRDSKLTRILQASLGGNSKTAIIATITPASLEESHSTLRFASQAKKIKNKAMANEVLSEAAMLKKLQKEIKHQQQLNELGKIENQDLKKSLEEMELRMKFIIQSGPTQSQAKRKRRETWCPGKKKSIFKPSVSFTAADEDIFLSEMPVLEELPESNENEAFAMMPTITTRGKRSFEQTKMKASISPDAKTKKLMDLEDKYEILLKEHSQLKTEFNDMSTFHNLERKSLEENIAELHDEKNTIMKECTKLSDEVIQKEHKLKIQTRRMTEFQSELEINRKANSLDASTPTIQEECEQLKVTIRQLEEEKASSKTDSVNSIDVMSKLQEECTILQKQVEELGTEKSELIEQVDTEQNKMATLTKDYEVLQNTAKDLVEERLKVQDTLTCFGLEVENLPILKEKFEELMQEKEDLAMELNSLKGEKETSETSNEREERKMEATDSTDVVNELMEECSTLKLQIEKLEAERTCTDGAEKVATLEEECEILRATVKDLADERLNIQDELTDVGSKIEQLPILKGKVEELLQEKEALAMELNSLKEEKETPETSNDDELQNLKETTSDLQHKLKHLEEEKTLLLAKLETLQSENRDKPTENRMTEMEEECRKLRETVQELEERKMEATDSTDDVNELKEECSTLKLQIEKLEAERTRADEGAEKVATLEEECEILRATVKEFADERLNMQDELTDVGSKIEQLPIVTEKCGKLEEINNQLVSEISHLKDTNISLKVQLGETSDSLNQELEVLRTEVQTKEALQQECDLLKAKLEDLSNGQATMQDEITNLKLKAEQLPCLQEKCDELLREKESHLAEISQGNTNFEQQSLEFHEKISVLELKLEERENNVIQLNSELKDLEMERQTKTAAFEKFKSIYKSMEIEKTELDEKVQSLEKELAERLSEQNEESGRVCALLEEMSEIQKNASQAENERSELQIKLEEATNKLQLTSEMEEEVINIQEEARRLQQENSQLTDKIEIMKHTLEMQKSQISQLSSVEKQKQECEETISVKNQELEQLKAEISTLKEETTSKQSTSVMKLSAPWEEEKKKLYKLLQQSKSKNIQQTEELNRLKQLTPLLLSKRDELEKELKKGVDESELGKKLKTAESDADKYYELYNQTQERMEELESSLKENQADMETIKARALKAEIKAEELQKMNARYWEELGEKKMTIFARDTAIERFEETKRTLVRQYEETIDLKDNSIKRLKAEIRQRDADCTYYESPQNEDNSSTSNNQNQMGVIDKFSAYMLEAKNQSLERQVKKLEKKVQKLEEHPVVKPEVQEIQTKFEEMRAEKEKIQTEFNDLKKRYFMKYGSRYSSKDEHATQTEDPKTSFLKERTNLRRLPTIQPKEQLSDNQCKQQ